MLTYFFLIGFVEINSNILETNLINIIILLSLIIYVSRSFLINSVDLRRKQILKTLENLDNNLEEANLRFLETTKQLKQINIIIAQLQKDNNKQKNISLTRKYNQLKIDLSYIFDNLIETLKKTKIESVRLLQIYLISFCIGRVLNKCKKLTNQEQQKILDSIILNLGGNN